MDNKLQKTGQNSLMDNFVKTDDILNDMCGIIESSDQYNSNSAIHSKKLFEYKNSDYNSR